MKFQDEFVHQLNSCSDLQQGRHIHASILHSHEHRHTLYLANLCIHMYSRCGGLREAKQTFDSIPHPNIFSWNIMLTAYARHGDLHQAELLFRIMPQRDIVSWTTMLTLLAQNSRLGQAQLLFDRMPMRNAISWNIIISAYAQHGHLDKAEAGFNSTPCASLATWNILMAAYSEVADVGKAQDMFDRIPVRDLVSWNILLSANAHNGHLPSAKLVLESMPEYDSVACSAMISAYGQAGLLREADALFSSIPFKGITTGNAMVSVYAHSGDLQRAKALFESMEQRDLVSWNAMLSSYAQHGMVESASEVFEKMAERDPVSWNTMLSAYADKGQVLAAEELFRSVPVRDVVTCNAMISGYAQNGLLESARSVFESMGVHDRVSCNAMIGAYIESGDGLAEARKIFDRMPKERSITTWNLMVEGYARHGHVAQAKELIEMMPEWSAVSWTSLMIGYTRRGDIEQAKAVFEMSPEKDCVSCNAMIQAHAENGDLEEAVSVFQSMPEASVVSWTTLINLYSTNMRFDEALGCFTCLPERNIVSWNAIVSAYAHNGHLRGSRRLFERMPERDVVSWSATVTAHARFGRANDAVELFRRMEMEGVSPDSVFFLSILVACSQKGLVDQGCQFIAMMIVEHGMKPCQEHYGSMVNILGRAGQLWNAEDLIHSMPYVAHAVAWGSLLDASKNQHEPLRRACAKQVLELDPGNCAPYLLTSPTLERTYEASRLQGGSTDSTSSPRTASDFIIALKNCRELDKGKLLHRDAVAARLHSNRYVASALINMYSDCGCMSLAKQVFDRITTPDVFLWTCLITGYVHNGMNSAAIHSFTSMDLEPNSVTFLVVLKALGRLARERGSEKPMCLERGISIHRRVKERGLDSKLVLATTLVDMYSKCGSMERARAVFDRMSHRSEITWNSLILGYVNNGDFITALSLFTCMDCKPTSISYVAALQACGGLGSEKYMSPCFCLEKGMSIHKRLKDSGFDSDIVVANALIDMYSKCASVSHAREVFGTVEDVRDVVTWTSLILGYVDNGQSEAAVDLFACMDCEPSFITYVVLLKACGGLSGEDKAMEKEFALERTMSVHKQVVGRGLGSSSSSEFVVVMSALLDVYCKLGAMRHARQVFNGMKERSVVTWNSLMLGYVANQESSVALELLASMDCEPSCITYLAALKACGGMAESSETKKEFCLDKVICIHQRIRNASLESDIVLSNALVDTYTKCGSTALGKQVFDSLEKPDTVTWNSLMAGYVDNGETFRALELFANMSSEPSTVTYVTVLKACACSVALEPGKSIHARVCKIGVESDRVVANTLLDLYVKCDCMSQAKEVFDRMATPDTVSWNTLITGYSSLADPTRTFQVAREMQVAGHQMDRVTFISLLTACSHAGLVKESKILLKSMPGVHGVNLNIQHYNCMVDVLGRASTLHEASALINEMPLPANSITWTTLLGSLRVSQQN